ncbi:SH3 domain-containing protein [Pseudoroseomonas wenyumeiae]|uniref:SH3 domain-containing protein n=2 Tax=Teichococcus wenyumeiae TaxID=2478470 RepID=A0A3A9JE22_9PROT|nr:SH3 domain-containing protein [Pseudoroseomonas wenyumeiae]RMI25440.1 SH3 domain-containing protein [Pseudoroseomonas wenyumeiae]
MAGLMVLLALPMALSGCDDAAPKAQAAQNAPIGKANEARQLAEAKLREALRGELSISQVETFPQADAATVAVCGQVALKGGQKAPFVSLVTLHPEGAAEAVPAVEQHVATDDVSATRVYVETRSRCTEKAAQVTQRLTAPPRLPPIPADLRTLAPPAPPQVARMEAEAAQVAAQARGGIAMRQNGNLRARPGGEVLRVVQRGASLRVFAEAPGGWLQVGSDSAEGWMHSSMVTRMALPEAAPTLTTAAAR